MSRLPVSHRRGEPAKTAGERLSMLQKRVLCWLDGEERRTHRTVSSSHQRLVQALPNAKGNISHSLRLPEARGLVHIGRSPGGQAENVRLSSAGCRKASKIAGSCD